MSTHAYALYRQLLQKWRDGKTKRLVMKATRERERVMAACCHKGKLTVLLQVELHQADAPCAVRFMYGS
jgi:hypothetical protein